MTFATHPLSPVDMNPSDDPPPTLTFPLMLAPSATFAGEDNCCPPSDNHYPSPAMCRYHVERWACQCEECIYLGPCNNPTAACKASAIRANRIDNPYACPWCSKHNIKFGNTRLPTSFGKKRSSDEFEEDHTSFAEHVDKSFAGGPNLELNLSIPPKRFRTSRGTYSSDAPQFRHRQANTYDEPTFTSRLTNPAEDLAYIDMPADVPQVLPPTALFSRSVAPNRRPGSSGDGGNMRRINSVLTHYSTRRSPTRPDSPVSPVTPPSARRMLPAQAALVNKQLRQTVRQPYYPPGYGSSFQADISSPQSSPPESPSRRKARMAQRYQAHKDEVERDIATGQYSANQIQNMHSFQWLAPQHQYELLETYKDCLPPDEPRWVPERVKRRPVPPSRKAGVIERFADWFFGRR